MEIFLENREVCPCSTLNEGDWESELKVKWIFQEKNSHDLLDVNNAK